MLEEVFRPIKRLLIIGLVVLLIFLFNFNNHYYSNVFKVTINEKEIYVEFYEQYSRGFIPFILGSINNISEQSNEVYPVVNEMPYNGQFKLNIKEYEVYWEKNNIRAYDITTWNIQDIYTYKEKKLSSTSLIIKRKNKIIYDGKYIENLSKYVNEKGRYFFQTVVKRQDNLYTTITTHMSFNVIVGGGNHE